MELKFIKYEKRGHIAYVTINRPEVMNSLHPPCHRELDNIWDDFMGDKNTWVAILTGAGDKAFSAGNDLKWTAEHGGDPLEGAKGGFAGLTARYDINKPIIAAVNGFALGGGLEIVLCCDLVVAAQHARFGLPEPRVGLMAAAGGVFRLPRHVPLKVAMGMMLTGALITAQEAGRWGIVNQVVAGPELIGAAEQWANEIIECSPLAVQATKEAAMGGLGLPVEQAMTKHFDAVAKLFRSKDAVEGPRAFAQKRKPIWTGE